jgi:hypothetical protein
LGAFTTRSAPTRTSGRDDDGKLEVAKLLVRFCDLAQNDGRTPLGMRLYFALNEEVGPVQWAHAHGRRATDFS